MERFGRDDIFNNDQQTTTIDGDERIERAPTVATMVRTVERRQRVHSSTIKPLEQEWKVNTPSFGEFRPRGKRCYRAIKRRSGLQRQPLGSPTPQSQTR